MSTETPEEFEYTNEYLLNQRGGSLRIINTTDAEAIQLSHRSGSNINFTNVVVSEFASNNKQVNVTGDAFFTSGRDNSVFIGGKSFHRTAGDTYSYNGYNGESELAAYESWKSAWRSIAEVNSGFNIQRGGVSDSNGVELTQSGDRADNPTLKDETLSLDNTFIAYIKTPLITSSSNEVDAYVPVVANIGSAKKQSPTKEEIELTAGPTGSAAAGVAAYGGDKSAATEKGTWDTNSDKQELSDTIKKLQEDELNDIESLMGDSGNKIDFQKGNSLEVVGTIFNDFPSIRIDPEGRSQPIEQLVAESGSYQNYDSIPVIEKVDNDSAFPCGDKTVVVGNRYNIKVGSGGFSVRSTGGVLMVGTSVDISGKDVKISGAHNMHISGDAGVEISSKESIQIRTNKQVYIQGSMGIHKNLIVGSSTYTEGETYLHHVTAPLEVQQTEDTILLGKFNTDTRKSLVIGETFCDHSGSWKPVFAFPNDDLIVTYPHSHHFNNIPIRLMAENKGVRNIAHKEGINIHGAMVAAQSQYHERKNAN